MKKVNIILKFEEEKLLALREYSKKKNIDFEEELMESLQKIYEKYVPSQVREYIEMVEKLDKKIAKTQKAKKTEKTEETAKGVI